MGGCKQRKGSAFFRWMMEREEKKWNQTFLRQHPKMVEKVRRTRGLPRHEGVQGQELRVQGSKLFLVDLQNSVGLQDNGAEESAAQAESSNPNERNRTTRRLEDSNGHQREGTGTGTKAS